MFLYVANLKFVLVCNTTNIFCDIIIDQRTVFEGVRKGISNVFQIKKLMVNCFILSSQYVMIKFMHARSSCRQDDISIVLDFGAYNVVCTVLDF